MLVPWRLKRPVSVLFVMVIPADTQGGATLIPVNDHEIATMSLDLNNLCPRSTLKTQRGICDDDVVVHNVAGCGADGFEGHVESFASLLPCLEWALLSVD